MPERPEATRRLVEVVRPLWSGDHTADALGLTLQQLETHGRAGRVLVLTSSDDALLVPVRQFVSTEGRVTIRPGLAIVLSVLVGVDPWAVAVLTLSEALVDELDGRTVMDAVRDHDFDVLFEFAVVAGRELGAKLIPPDIHVAKVLAGLDSYDDADTNTQARVRKAWDQRSTAALQSLNLHDEFVELGRGWTELDNDGQLTRRNPEPPPPPPP